MTFLVLFKRCMLQFLNAKWEILASLTWRHYFSPVTKTWDSWRGNLSSRHNISVLLFDGWSPCWWDFEYIDCIPLQRGKISYSKKGCPEYNITSHLMVRLQFWRYKLMDSVENPFIAMTPRSTLNQCGSTS